MAEVARADVAIVGGGFVGFALAAALARAGAAVTVLEPQLGRPRRDPRASAFAAGPRRLMEAIGAWDAIAPHAQPMLAMEVGDARLADVMRPVHLAIHEEAEPGEPFAQVVDNNVVMEALEAAALASGARVLPLAATALESRASGATLTLSDGGRLAARLVVAADGVNSRVRQWARIRTMGWRYDQTAIVATVGLEQDHGGTAVQHFLEGGPFALLPMTQRRAAVVWSDRRLQAERMMRLSDDAFLAALEERAGGVFGALTLAGPRAAMPLELKLARRFASGRVALIGDAAHRIHPLAGQGVNLGFRDVAALAQCVVEAGRLGLDIGSGEVLDRYERWRRFDTMTMAIATDTLGRLFRMDVGIVRLLRDVGMGLVDRAPRLKSALVRSAAGLSGDAPRLLRGEAL